MPKTLSVLCNVNNAFVLPFKAPKINYTNHL